jgi:hypothetical protein
MNRRGPKSAVAAGIVDETWIDGNFPGGEIAFSIKSRNEEKTRDRG